MAEFHGERTIDACIADGAIARGHTVDLVSSVGGQKHVAQNTGANEGWGVYIGDDAAAQYDHVEICTRGRCIAWLDGAITVSPPQAIANDADGHIVADTTDKHRILGFAVEENGATENFGEIDVNPGFNAA
jgi:hypothetical protein